MRKCLTKCGVHSLRSPSSLGIKKMRAATQNDLDFLADCLVKISRQMKVGEADTFILGLPSVVDDTISRGLVYDQQPIDRIGMGALSYEPFRVFAT